MLIMFCHKNNNNSNNNNNFFELLMSDDLILKIQIHISLLLETFIQDILIHKL